jgi:hypothetical protein
MADLANVFASADEIVVRMKVNNPLIDFAGPGRRVYQGTNQKDHSMSLDGLQDLLTAAGYMVVKDNKYVMVDVDLPKLDFFWVVPAEIFHVWLRGPKTVEDYEIGRTLEKYVNQFVLSVDVIPPKEDDTRALPMAQPVLIRRNVVFAGTVPQEVKDKVIARLEKQLGAKVLVQRAVDETTRIVVWGKGAKNQQQKMVGAYHEKIPLVAAQELQDGNYSYFDTSTSDGDNDNAGRTDKDPTES